MRGVRVGADAGVGVGDAVLDTDHRRHLLQIDLVHDPVARRDHVDVLERALRPVDEVEPVLVATVFDGAVLLEGVRIEAAALDGERVVDDQLHRHHRVHLRRIATEIGDGVAQAGEVDERRLAEDVVADHARREPREVEVALALDELAQVVGDARRLGAADDVLGVHARGVGQRGPGPGTDRVDGLAGVEIVEAGAG